MTESLMFFPPGLFGLDLAKFDLHQLALSSSLEALSEFYKEEELYQKKKKLEKDDDKDDEDSDNDSEFEYPLADNRLYFVFGSDSDRVAICEDQVKPFVNSLPNNPILQRLVHETKDVPFHYNCPAICHPTFEQYVRDTGQAVSLSRVMELLQYRFTRNKSNRKMPKMRNMMYNHPNHLLAHLKLCAHEPIHLTLKVYISVILEKRDEMHYDAIHHERYLCRESSHSDSERQWGVSGLPALPRVQNDDRAVPNGVSDPLPRREVHSPTEPVLLVSGSSDNPAGEGSISSLHHSSKKVSVQNKYFRL